MDLRQRAHVVGERLSSLVRMPKPRHVSLELFREQRRARRIKFLKDSLSVARSRFSMTRRSYRTHASAILIVCAAIPTSVAAQAKDATYCTQLGSLTLRYTGGAGSNGRLEPDLTTIEAIDECNKGNTAAGIPVLEKTLRNNGFTLPKR